MILEAKVGAEQAGMRLDDGAKALFPGLSKGDIRRVIDRGAARLAEFWSGSPPARSVKVMILPSELWNRNDLSS